MKRPVIIKKKGRRLSLNQIRFSKEQDSMLKRPNPKDLSLTNIIKKIAKKKNHKHFSKNEEASPLVV